VKPPRLGVGGMRAVPRLCIVYPGICLTTEENHGKPHSGFNLGFFVTVFIYMCMYCLLVVTFNPLYSYVRFNVNLSVLPGINIVEQFYIAVMSSVIK
jgi:hypothetical protein